MPVRTSSGGARSKGPTWRQPTRCPVGRTRKSASSHRGEWKNRRGRPLRQEAQTQSAEQKRPGTGGRDRSRLEGPRRAPLRAAGATDLSSEPPLPCVPHTSNDPNRTDRTCTLGRRESRGGAAERPRGTAVLPGPASDQGIPSSARTRNTQAANLSIPPTADTRASEAAGRGCSV